MAVLLIRDIVLASSMKLEYPMNSVLPSTEHARDRLLAKMFRYRSSGKRAQSTTDGDFALLYAYCILPKLSFPGTND